MIERRLPILLTAQANNRLSEIEGYALEDLAAQLYQERSRLGLGDFQLTERILGYWDRSDVEIDLVAVAADDKTIRFGTCKRQADKLLNAVPSLFESAVRFLSIHKQFGGWRVEYTAIAPSISDSQRAKLMSSEVIPQSLTDLCEGL